ncbi:uncharacterized protein PHALS_03173 [Plasmopara halstedii]|uniref:Uncharacterized protein n=1 Tax=Plasmopara halstedii TaxID=4781 RepID=A0A0P1A3Y6_PLAHL|nr:uncharacterized protein PHALS_03173 [Plasmopara halstedii]CEG35201.1 hypothetical protein PHALS_03173 [Plasmopara halstedii]|eukprot:XP_024571570.1 hypothetical protein PHALS_03173 [Plasmopara halstedii]
MLLSALKTIESHKVDVSVKNGNTQSHSSKSISAKSGMSDHMSHFANFASGKIHRSS